MLSISVYCAVIKLHERHQKMANMSSLNLSGIDDGCIHTKTSKLVRFPKQDACCLSNLWGFLLLVLVEPVYVATLADT